MPLYTYKCLSCDKHETKLIKITEPAGVIYKCECGGDQHREFDLSGTSFQLKGENWYSKSGKY